jgi:putative tricarboxylic transport membrane protein
MKALPLTCFFFFLASGGYLVGAMKLPLGTAARPGAGLYPSVLGIVLVILSAALVVLSLKAQTNPKEEPEDFPRGNNLNRVVGLTVVLAGFAIFLKWLGFIFCSSIILAATLKIFGLKSWAKALMISFLAAGCFYFLFSRLLEVPLPLGTVFS